MNLGDIYLKTFFCITSIAFLAAVAVVGGIRFWRRVNAGWLIALSILMGMVFPFIGNSFFHQPVFVDWHRCQNEWVPKTGCLTYEPSFGRLFATYAMTETEFRDWVSNYPVPMGPYDNSLLMFDSEQLGFTAPELSFATQPASNGKQLRVYWADGKMYLSYNVM